ncbi:MAG: alanine racemase [Pseudomonadota bacterium]
MNSSFHAGGRLTIDLGALAANYKTLANLAAPGACGAAVKADAYGLGIDRVAPALWDAGCREYFVALPEEAFHLRELLPDATIYCLGGLTPGGAQDYRSNRIVPVLNTMDEVDAWARSGKGAASAIHVDTGMNRLGLSLEEAQALVEDRDRLTATNCQLVMTHLACADTPEHPLNAHQVELFEQVKKLFPNTRASFANSAGTLLGQPYKSDLSRPGIALYGGASAPVDPNPIRPVVTLEARIMQVRRAHAGETVGYGAAETLKADARLAILGAGYADGFHRLSGSSDGRPGGSVKLNGASAPLVGRVSMDLMAADISAPVFDEVQAGDLATLINEAWTVDNAAAAMETIGYEVLTSLGRRYQRVYREP